MYGRALDLVGRSLGSRLIGRSLGSRQSLIETPCRPCGGDRADRRRKRHRRASPEARGSPLLPLL